MNALISFQLNSNACRVQSYRWSDYCYNADKHAELDSLRNAFWNKGKEIGNIRGHRTETRQLWRAGARNNGWVDWESTVSEESSERHELAFTGAWKSYFLSIWTSIRPAPGIETITYYSNRITVWPASEIMASMKSKKRRHIRLPNWVVGIEIILFLERSRRAANVPVMHESPSLCKS